ncbi:isoprenyl transferase [Magnetospira sp. QH-2]|uniref:isoprenyl transferase n=1 Tax=Magnetospira sp. (strain QH-2) TaxID=1288970 RepID=UPI0003E81748|nr:Undecaprenyl pyrophosphate synthetase 2 (UPP synthetase 2) (Di-trans,poly-cis-decaprenylcistransferase 2) (Undecaprenyl diphosphate synthase 2) (UDS 2) [Magnetospira sp. QH-2]
MKPAPQIPDDPQPPVHVAIIMDGNGRWAKARKLPRAAGHKKGADAVKKVVRAAGELGVSYLTLYSFSSENWKRPPSEVKDLMGLLRLHLKSEIADLHKNNVRLLVIGDRSGLAADIVDLIEIAETKTGGNTGLTLVLALNYGGRGDIAATAQRLAAEAAAGRLNAEDITEDLFSDHMDTAGMPEPDLLIRTGGDQRISNFLLWEMAYTEFLFVEKFWPEFGADDLEKAVMDFKGRERRFGAVGS